MIQCFPLCSCTITLMIQCLVTLLSYTIIPMIQCLEKSKIIQASNYITIYLRKTIKGYMHNLR